VLELCTGGALDARLACKGERPAALPWQQRVRIACGIASALTHLHSMVPQMIHRDLKVVHN
jgi:serine/threonine protein kinase